MIALRTADSGDPGSLVGVDRADPAPRQSRSPHLRRNHARGERALRALPLVRTAERRQTTPGAAYGAFAYGLIIWGWQLLSFYTGFVTGPRKAACPPDCRGLARFVRGRAHEPLSRAGGRSGALALLALTAGQPNQLALWTYLVLWWMHQSAKLNVILRRPQLGRGDAAGPSRLSRELHGAAADEPVFPVLGDDLHDCDGAAVRARGRARTRRRSRPSATRCFAR